MVDSRKKSIILYHDWYEGLFQHISYEEVGKIVMALMRFDMFGEDPDGDYFSNNLEYVFFIMKSAVKRDRDKYLKKCEQNQTIAIKREWHKRNPNGSEEDFDKYLHDRTRT